MKRLPYEMADQGIVESKNISSFLIECMTYNTPNTHFSRSTYADKVRYVLTWLSSNMENATGCEEWVEVSGMEWLFHTKEARRRAALAWIDKAWSYIN